MTGAYDGVVYDLDGTLVSLDVDWDAVREDAAALLSARGVDTAGTDLWDLIELDGAEHRRSVVDVIAEHEREGARTARRLPLADELPLDGPVGVCSLNCEAACRIALEMHGLDRDVDVIVGRDTVGAHKPDPEPLLAALEDLSAEPSQSLFVGDSERDAKTARRAGVQFQFTADRADGG
ncbi:MAG: HAD family hydrolase [Haloarculaceae archaeon]